MFKAEVSATPFDWKQSVSKHLQVLVNVGREEPAAKLIYEKDAIKYCELLLTLVKALKDEGTEFEIVSRTLNLVGKLCKVPAALLAISQSTPIQKKLMEYYCSAFAEIQKQALICFHASCKTEGFRDACFKKHGLDENMSQFGPIIKKAIDLYNKAVTE
jgi:hypothetical protein